MGNKNNTPPPPPPPPPQQSQNIPPPGYPPYNPYVAAPPPEYYYYQSYDNTGHATSILCSLLCLIMVIALIAGGFNLYRIMHRPELPSIRVDSLTVPNFNVANSQLNANWVASFTTSNGNNGAAFVLGEIAVYVIYKNTYLASWKDGRSFELGSHGKGTMIANLEKSNWQRIESENWVAGQMAEDRKNGMVSFNMRVDALAVYKARGIFGWGWGWNWGWSSPTTGRTMSLRFYCNDIQVGFSNANPGTGTSFGSRDCKLD